MKREDFEIMAPVGSRESLSAAFQSGADAIYFGVEELNMRARAAGNFTADDMSWIARACRERGVKSYLTLNTVVHEHEVEKARDIIGRAREAGVTAIIASDMAVILEARALGVEVHASTQCNVTNTEALRFLSRYVDVVVLARELDLEQVSAIHRRVVEEGIRGPGGLPVRVEMFAHGALCMAVSGKCYLSLHEMNAAANRGECLQPCRRAYAARDVESDIELEIDGQYIMSPKDLCTIGFLDKMVSAGVRVFKIEGRARPAEYTRVTCTCYDEALRALVSGEYTAARVEEWRRRLSTVFHRGFWDGYYLGRRLGEWSAVHGSAATRRKERVGRVTNYYARPGVAECRLESGELRVGDRVLFVGPTTGAEEEVVRELRLDVLPVERVGKGAVFSMPSGVKVRRGDVLYKWSDVAPGTRG
ncbi:MAG: U32 family peptidase [Odoribacteraceae bacterium]|jgi:putative protease|nr:U32 family peptidase [Odoribacteraceae bacterium]